MLTKTLTFGLGKIHGFDEKPYALQADIETKVYSELIIGFRDFARVCNFSSSLLYISKTLNIDLKTIELNKSYGPLLKKIQIDTHLNGKVLSQSYGATKVHFTGCHGERINRGEMALPTHRADGKHPLYFRQDAVKIYREENNFYVLYNVFATKWAKVNGFPDWIAFPIIVKNRDKVSKTQLENILNGVWKQGGGQLVKNPRTSRRKYIMHLSVKYDPQPFKALSNQVVMGIDIGVNTPAAIHIRGVDNGNKWAMLVGNGHLLIQSRYIVRREIVGILRVLNKKDSPIVGKDRSAMQEKLRDLRKREKRIIKTASQRIASTIADTARRAGAGIWQMEKLSGSIKEGKTWLAKNWAPGVLVDAIRWQATQNDAQLTFINPQYTSQRCNKCGYIDTENRPKQKKGASAFLCQKCGNEDHADKNAAKNISIIGIEKIIEEEVKSKKGCERNSADETDL